MVVTGAVLDPQIASFNKKTPPPSGDTKPPGDMTYEIPEYSIFQVTFM